MKKQWSIPLSLSNTPNTPITQTDINRKTHYVKYKHVNQQADISFKDATHAENQLALCFNIYKIKKRNACPPGHRAVLCFPALDICAGMWCVTALGSKVYESDLCLGLLAVNILSHVPVWTMTGFNCTKNCLGIIADVLQTLGFCVYTFSDMHSAWTSSLYFRFITLN